MSEDSQGTFQRCPHDRENPYAQISRDLIRDKTLSPRCRWFIIYCLSFDNNWKISIPYFIEEQNLSKDIMYAIINECLKSGYMKREEFIVKGLKRYKYFISESPKFKKCLPCLENPDTGKPDTVFPDTTNKQSSSREEETKEQIEETPPTPSKGKSAKAACVSESSSSFELHGEFVQLKKEQLSDLCKNHGEPIVKDIISQINDYIAAHGKKGYKDYSAAIRQWIRRREDHKKPSFAPQKNTFLSKHQGLNKDHSPRNPSRTFDFSGNE